MMKHIFFLLFVCFLSLNTFAQIKSSDLKDFQLTKQEHEELKNYLISKNLKLKDTIFIKYDFKNEDCWDCLDEMDDDHVNNVVKSFQYHILNFNETFETVVAYNFRQPGKRFNKLKLRDTTIILDDTEFLKNLIFKNKVQCGTSAMILNDGTYMLYERDPHFEILSLHHNYSGKKF